MKKFILIIVLTFISLSVQAIEITKREVVALGNHINESIAGTKIDEITIVESVTAALIFSQLHIQYNYNVIDSVILDRDALVKELRASYAPLASHTCNEIAEKLRGHKVTNVEKIELNYNHTIDSDYIRTTFSCGVK
ncbi:hypothetical protein G3R49_12305 [Shewanella sp. WXL01]|uniref:hypothetical protein n=1 Tax=Shewanella sp. WXL01 TaxID=2709721 RepID=UPI0014384A99|nr:hypothetical protein [Shewanella sp. WXL01]NKF51339.1 hypothetical protein [Shewanella sp. WXL01]